MSNLSEAYANSPPRTLPLPPPRSVGMGEVLLISGDEQCQSVLGSCIGVALWHRGLRLGALAHVVLPQPTSNTFNPGRFATSAIPLMLREVSRRGAQSSNLVAKLVGGANVLAAPGPLQVAEMNLAAVIEALGQRNIPIVAKHVGGNSSRRMSFFAATGTILVQIGDQTIATL